MNARVPNSDAADVQKAVEAAKAAFPAWSAKPVAERAAIINRIADIIERVCPFRSATLSSNALQRLDEFAKAESQDQGKTVGTAKTVDIPRSVKNFRFFSGAVLYHGVRFVLWSPEWPDR